MEGNMKKLIYCVLCVMLFLTSVPTIAVADSAYSTTSNKDVALEYPAADSYYAIPQRATVKASKANGSIYFMPTPKDGNGVLGTVANGTEVTIYAKQNGFYYFMTADGRAGWNGTRFFTVLGPVSFTSNEELLFCFEHGATVTLPSGFISTGVECDSDNSCVCSYYIHPDQDMELTLREYSTDKFYQSGAELLNFLYIDLKGEYPDPTYDSLKNAEFDLSGYFRNSIYYFKGVLSNQAIYLIQMFYPTRNRSICDRYVEAVTESFEENGLGLSFGRGYSTHNLPMYPESPYAIALRQNLIDGVFYSDGQKKDIVNETYYDRKDSKGDRRDWYTSSSYNDPNTGYQIGFYYADGLVFFADAYHTGERSSVTFYFWGDQLLCVHDLRNGDKALHFAGSEQYNAIIREFGDLYTQALNHQP